MRKIFKPTGLQMGQGRKSRGEGGGGGVEGKGEGDSQYPAGQTETRDFNAGLDVKTCKVNLCRKS